MAQQIAYTVELSTVGHKRKEVYYAGSPNRARKQAREEHPKALIYEVDTL